MNRKQKIKFVQDELLKWYEVNQRKFPWRKKSMNAYRYIISETLLQRTKAETIAKFYPEFIKTYPNWESLNRTHQKTIAKDLKPIGLYKQRSSRLKGLAKEMVRINGRLPKERSELEKIPFFGQYIVNAVMLFIHKQPAPLLDVNMARVLERVFGPRKLSDIRYDPYLQKLSQDYINHNLPNELNWAVLDFAAMVCKPLKPLCFDCRLRYKCYYFKDLVKDL